MSNTFGYPQSQWDAAKIETPDILRDVARRSRLISYSELAQKLTSISFTAEDHRFHNLLGQLSEDEHAAGRGLISALVVHKSDGQQGSGFFKLAKTLRADAYEEVAFCASEVQRIFRENGGRA